MSREGLPPPAKSRTSDEKQTTEVLRLWWIEGAPEVVMWPAFNNPEWFGVILSDVVRQMAQVYGQAGLAEPGKAYEQIVQGLTRALENSTYAPDGQDRSGEISVEKTTEPTPRRKSKAAKEGGAQ